MDEPQAGGRLLRRARGRPFFDELCAFMSSGPTVVQVLEGENAILRNREIMGATDPAKAAEGTIRKEFATSIGENSVHGSDAAETARAGDRLLVRRDRNRRVTRDDGHLPATELNPAPGVTPRHLNRRERLMAAATQIKQHMEVLGSDGEHVGTVDHLEGDDMIKLTQTDSPDGQHHYLSADFVDRVDEHVHLNITAAEAVEEWEDRG